MGKKTQFDNARKHKTLTEEVLAILTASKRAMLIDRISTEVTLTRHQCRIRKVLDDLVAKGEIYLASDGWQKSKPRDLDKEAA